MLAQTTAKVAHALAHPTRVQILDLLRDEGAYVMHLTAMLGRPQANISQHLMVLVVSEREGMTVLCRVRDPRVFEVLDRLKALVKSRVEEGAVGRLSDFPPHPPKVEHNGAFRCRCPRCRKDME